MNLRQKAKRFKKLYEDALPQKTYPGIYEAHSAKHYKVRNVVDEREIAYAQQTPQLFKTYIENGILRELRPVIWNNLKAEQDLRNGKIIYSLDVWM